MNSDGRQAALDHAGTRHVAGLDAIRFVCALWVVFGHVGFIPLVEGIDRTSRLGRLVGGVVGNLISGPAAVIVFFVISGFCIHYPYRDGGPIPLKAYYSRRYVRILVPMTAAILLGRPLGLELTVLSDSIIWSLLCEEIYYLVYPLLLALRRSWSWRPVIGVAYAGALIVVLTNPTAGNYPSYGAGLNWLLGLPCWLLGCLLAESNLSRAPSERAIWTWRAGIWGLSWACSVLRFHSPLKYPWTLNLFALAVFFWLAREIAFAKVRQPTAWLERGGRFSYSMYLVHLHAWALYVLLGLPFLGHLLDWTLKTGFVLVVCYAFYRLVERPSHTAARRIGERLLARSTPVAAVSQS